MPETKTKLTPHRVGRPRKADADKLIRLVVFLLPRHLTHYAPNTEARRKLGATIRAALDAEMERTI